MAIEIIEKDKIKEVREGFYDGIMKKIARNKADDANSVIRKRHLGMSIAAGIAIGILVGGIYHHKTDRQVAMQEWIGKYNMNDIKLECIEDKLFN